MALKVIIFDFDGTLVDSNDIKYQAFFELFPRDDVHKAVITEVLKEYREQSRYVILEKILRGLQTNKKQLPSLEQEVEKYAGRYNSAVVNLVKRCNEKPGTAEMLNFLHQRYKLYLSSTTPEVSLKEIVEFRGWGVFFVDIFGYPRNKIATVERIMGLESAAPSEILIVGDGESDKASAAFWGCQFYNITSDRSLIHLMQNHIFHF